MDVCEKKQALYEYIKGLKSVAVAFSAGVDSTFLLKVAHDALGDNAVAFTVRSGTFPEKERAEAKSFCDDEGIKQVTIDFDELSIDGFADNPKNRCYLCKKGIFGLIKKKAEEMGVHYVLEGSNVDDEGDYRPGLVAIKELGVLSPLRKVGLTKSEIRLLSKQAGLKTYDKPSFACLASRVPYGEKITAEKLKMIEKAERFLLDAGFIQVRVRTHEKIARIEILTEQFEKFFADGFYKKVDEYFKSLGYDYVCLDLGGYKTGNLNKGVYK